MDDEEAVCWALQRALTRDGHQVTVASCAEDAFEETKKHTPDTVVLDVRLPGMDGITALAEFQRTCPDAPVIIITAHGNLNTAVKAVEGGAFDYLAKPFDLDQALETVQRALQRRFTSTPESESEPVIPSEEFVGKSPVMQTVFKRIALVAPRDSCVLITGESGCGKELVARAVHRFSSRREHPFLPVHIASLNPSLVESELFGHARGAFTGATQSREGLLALANGGTVFLDELADIPLSVQVKLLRVLEHNEVLPVGSSQPQPLNVRILTATNADLDRQVAEGLFRHDLFFRLNVFRIHLPPLRERKEDIEPLAEHFLRKLSPDAVPLLPKTLDYLTNQPWYGNVRELRNALEHAVIVARGGPLLPEHFPRLSTLHHPNTPEEDLAESIRRWFADRTPADAEEKPTDLYEKLLGCVEPVLLKEVLDRLHGNRLAAAQWLGLNRATVRKKLGMYGMNEEGNERQT